MSLASAAIIAHFGVGFVVLVSGFCSQFKRETEASEILRESNAKPLNSASAKSVSLSGSFGSSSSEAAEMHNDVAYVYVLLLLHAPRKICVTPCHAKTELRYGEPEGSEQPQRCLRKPMPEQRDVKSE